MPFGISFVSISMNVITMSAENSASYMNALALSPIKYADNVHNTALSDSTIGYLAEIFSLQFLHFPPRKIQLKTGTMSYHFSGCPHFGQ